MLRSFSPWYDFMLGEVTPLCLVRACEDTQGIFRGGIILEKVNFVDPTTMELLAFIVFEDHVGRLTWYLFYFYMSI